MTTTHAVARRSPVRRLASAARWLTTPLLPEDYLGLVNPLWSTAELRGRIEGIRHEAPGAATVEIRTGPDWAGHVPGQWVRIGVDIDGVRHWRSFSLSSPPRRDGRITVTVKANPDGLVSRYLVERAEPGTIVRLEPAGGDFTLPDAPGGRGLLFLTAGSGITPVMAMLRHLDAAGPMPDTVLVHSARTPGDVIFGAELRRLAERTTNFTLIERHTAADGRFKLADLTAACADWAERDAWVCGPADLLDEAEAHWAAEGDPALLRVERFQAVLAGGGGEGGHVRFAASGVETDADGATPLLVAGEDAGALLPSGCRMGICYSCVGRLRSGQVRDLRTGEVHGEEGHMIQTCVSAAAGPVEIDL
ncbi:ferredoxin reductase [Actinomadura parmotrematis]|uniref:Ferredoxin reductase n=1 Tax=Actinomadura parmotrematis TaxID=2864039 RepID=A0ABS7G3Z2_9ACTN|nr:ferredoxin reductase [Actinomadura parmotrematis]MBW8487261.1 ferredoxin reductase [Actinomadura parmotrematis]